MKYICLIFDSEANSATTPEAQEAEIGAYMAFGETIRKDGVSTGMGEALQPTSTATTVRVRDGKTLTTDGPFAETKEQLGGFYILDCEDIDQAIKYAAMIPGAKQGCVEIRPLLVFDFD